MNIVKRWTSSIGLLAALTSAGALLASSNTRPSAQAPGPSQVGQWSSVMNWPVVAVHATLMPTGDVLAWTDFTSNGGAQIWRRASNSFTPRSFDPVSLFCAAHVLLADGRVFVSGGIVGLQDDLGPRESEIFDPISETWTPRGLMTTGRYYPTTTVLGDGRVIVVGGTTTCTSCIADTPEIYNPATDTWTPMANSARLAFQYYPHLFLLPDGRVIAAGQDDRAISTRALNLTTQQWTTIDSRIIDGHSSAMYLPGKIVKAGKATADSPGLQAVATTFTLDMTQPSPTWQPAGSMAFRRSFLNLTTLPDGQVLATGGSLTTDPADKSDAVYEAEIWSPTTRNWTTMARMQRPRLYHSTALLLPDATVLVAGGGRQNGRSQPDPADEANAEIFSPPYLFKGPRPTMTSAPPLVPFNSSFFVATPDATRIGSVAMIAPGSVTHAFNQNQRFIPLSFTQTVDGINVMGPIDGNTAPPGPYMLFLVDNTGVPSVAAWVRVPAPGEDAQPPTAPSNLAVTASIGAANLSWLPGTDNIGISAYNIHRSTTPGFTPLPANLMGQSTGTTYADTNFQTAATYYYRVTAGDAAGNISAPSNEASADLTPDTTPPSVTLTVPVAGATLSGNVTVLADASDNVGVIAVQFLIDGASLGPEITFGNPSYSYPWNTSTTPNGTHTLAVRARDGAGNVRTTTNITVTVANAAPTGLVAAYGFDEGTGTSLTDISGQGLNGTIVGATWATGKYGNALSFNGTGNYVDLGNPTALRFTGSMTIEAWVFATGNPADDGQIVAKSSNTGWQFKTSPDTGPHTFGLGVTPTDESDQTQRYTTTVRSLNTWYHVAGVYDATARTMSTYVNGVLDNGTLRGTIPASQLNSDVNVNIGRRTSGYYFKGLIDEIRIYSRALSQAEIQNDMITPVKPTADTTVPAVSLTSPAGGSSLTGTLNITATATDNAAMAGVQFFVDGTPIGAEVTGLGPTYTYNWNTTTTPDGPHTITARARDAASNTATSTGVGVTVANADTAPPTVWMSAPANGSSVAGTITISGWGHDNVGMSGLQFLLDGNPLGSEVAGAGPTYTMSWDTTAIADGPHTLACVGRDTSNNTKTSADFTVTVVNVDTAGPTVSVTSPGSGATINGAVSLTASGTDNLAMAGVQFLLDGNPVGAEVTGAGPTYTLSWNSTTVADGPHTIAARGRDTSNNTTTTPDVAFTVKNTDTTAPTISLTAPSGGASVNGTISVTASAADDVAMAGVQVYLDGSALGSELTGAGPTYTQSWATTGVANGQHTLTARARDTSNNTTTSADLVVNVDNDVTAPTVSVTAPAGGATVAGTISIAASAADNVAMAGVQFFLDGNPIGTEVSGPGPTFTRSWNSTTVGDGAHTVAARARDTSGNTTTTADTTFTVKNADTTAPTISLTAPAGGATVSGTINVTASAADNIAMAGVQFFVDGNALGAEVTGAGPTYTRSWTTTGASNGSHTLTACARDTSNNTAITTDVVVNVNNDTTVPTISLTAPAGGATVTGTISVTASAADNIAMAGVQFLLDGGNLGTEVPGTGPSYTLTWSTATATNGVHTLSARARDTSGNTALATNVSVTVSNAAPAGLVAAYGFNEGAGKTLTDLSGHGLNGSISGTATWVNGKFGKALSFNGSNNYVNLGTPAALQFTGSMTFEAWVYATGNPADDGQIISKYSNAGWQFKTSPDTGPHTFGLSVSPDSSSDTQRYSTTVRALKTWYHVAGVYDAAARTLSVYVNGVLDNGVLRGTVIPATQYNSTANVNIGRRIAGYYFKGMIDEIRIYNRALSQSEILIDMSTPVTSSAPLPEPLPVPSSAAATGAGDPAPGPALPAAGWSRLKRRTRAGQRTRGRDGNLNPSAR